VLYEAGGYGYMLRRRLMLDRSTAMIGGTFVRPGGFPRDLAPCAFVFRILIGLGVIDKVNRNGPGVAE
jgi:hypothetical protein